MRMISEKYFGAARTRFRVGVCHQTLSIRDVDSENNVIPSGFRLQIMGSVPSDFGLLQKLQYTKQRNPNGIL